MHDSFWTHPSDVDEMGTSLRKVNNNMCLMADFLFECARSHLVQKAIHPAPLPAPPRRFSQSDFTSGFVSPPLQISFLFPHSALQFRAQLSRRDSPAGSQSASTLKSFDDIERSFDEECPLPPRGNLVRGAGAFWVALIMFCFGLL